MAHNFRCALPADLSEIVAIYNAAIPSRMSTADMQPVTASSKTLWFESHTGKRPLWVGEENGRVAAWLSFSDFYGRGAYKITSEISIYVHEDFRRKGWGAYLLQQAIQHTPDLELENLLGFVFAHNAPSVNLFHRFGFETWGSLPQVANLDGLRRDLLILGRHVTRHA